MIPFRIYDVVQYMGVIIYHRHYSCCCRESRISLEIVIRFKVTNFSPGFVRVVLYIQHDWRWSKIFPIVLYHFDQNIIVQSWLLYVSYMYIIMQHTQRQLKLHSRITRLRVFNPAITDGGRWGEYIRREC